MALVGFGPFSAALDRTGEYKLDTSTVAGTILVEDADNVGDLVAADNAAAFVLEHDVTDDGVTTLDFLLGDAKFVTKKGSYCNAIRLRPGMVLEVDQFASGTDVGAIDETTASGTALGVASGKFRVAQTAPTADTVIAELVENKVETTGTIVVRIKSLG